MEKQKNKKNVFAGFIAGTFIFLMIVLVFAATALWGFIQNRIEAYEDKINQVNESKVLTEAEEETQGIPANVSITEVAEKIGDESGRIDLNNDGIGDLEFELGEEGLNAEYYPLLTNYLRYDLSYSVLFMEYSNADNSVSCIYPKLKGNKNSIDYINQLFYNFAVETKKTAENNACHVQSQSYVTYMDENIMSVVFTEVYTKGNNANYEAIYCYTLDMSADEFKLYKYELSDTSDEFLEELEARCLKESPNDASYLFGNYSKDDIRDDILTKADGLVAFYTPLGMEIGINYDGYWCCATFKDYTNYILEKEE